MEVRIKKTTLTVGAIVVLLGLVVFLGYKLYVPQTGQATSYGTSSGANVFEGKITNVQVQPGTIEGTSAYDSNCVGQPITECDGGIQTKEYGLLNFHYRHDMSAQPCINMYGPEKMTVQILNSNGDAKIIRLQDFGMVGHHG